ncbi:MAG: hypothetical protein OK454_07025, partial [Thaumarchaeota archaeon]|nr:hypothetical protein [Nitrososphaerota archaeon]
MSEFTLGVLSVALVKAVVIITGLSCIWMGYRLFMARVLKGGAEVRADASLDDDQRTRGASGKNKGARMRAGFSMSRGGPGLVFALFGAGIVVVGILRDSWVKKETKGPDSAGTGQVSVSEEVHPYVKEEPLFLKFLFPPGSHAEVETRQKNHTTVHSFSFDGYDEMNTGWGEWSTAPVR